YAAPRSGVVQPGAQCHEMKWPGGAARKPDTHVVTVTSFWKEAGDSSGAISIRAGQRAGFFFVRGSIRDAKVKIPASLPTHFDRHLLLAPRAQAILRLAWN